VSKGRWAVPGYKVRLQGNMDQLRRHANNPAGEVRRSVRTLSIFFPCRQNVPNLGCITYVFVNSSGEWKCILDFDHLQFTVLGDFTALGIPMISVATHRFQQDCKHSLLSARCHLDFVHGWPATSCTQEVLRPTYRSTMVSHPERRSPMST
jgi:hypothetical protein